MAENQETSYCKVDKEQAGKLIYLGGYSNQLFLIIKIQFSSI